MRVEGLRFWVEGLGSRDKGSEFELYGLSFRVEGLGFRVWVEDPLTTCVPSEETPTENTWFMIHGSGLRV